MDPRVHGPRAEAGRNVYRLLAEFAQRRGGLERP